MSLRQLALPWGKLSQSLGQVATVPIFMYYDILLKPEIACLNTMQFVTKVTLFKSPEFMPVY